MKYKIKISDEESMKFNGELLKFDREAECDWCGKKKLVSITHYGTSNYNRLICKTCAENIKDYNKRVFGVTDSKIKDSDTLYKMAYELGQLANYFDRANSSNSRELLAKEDNTKIAQFYTLGLKTLAQIKKENEQMSQHKDVAKYSFDTNKIVALILDAANKMYFMYSFTRTDSNAKKFALLSDKLKEQAKLYNNLTIKDSKYVKNSVNKYVVYAVPEEKYEVIESRINSLPSFRINNKKEKEGYVEFEVSGDSFDNESWKKLDALVKEINTHINTVVYRRSHKDSKYVKDAPDKYGLPTDEELEAEFNSKRESLRKQREEALAKEQEENRKKQEIENKYARDLNIIRNSNNIEDMQKMVPQSGQADTVAGELVRAFMKLEYRWYNDGDTFFTGYGYTDTCSSPAAFICKYNMFDQDFFYFVREDHLKYDRKGFVDPEKMGYTQFIEDLGKNLFEYIKDNAEDLMRPTTDMFDEDGERYFEYVNPRYNWEVKLPADVRDKANVKDIYEYFENLYFGDSSSNFDVTVNTYGGWVGVYNLKDTEYAEAIKWNIDLLWNEFREEYGIRDDEVDLEDCKFKDSNYSRSLITSITVNAYLLSRAETNSEEKDRENTLYKSIQKLCTISKEEVKNSLKTTQGEYAKKAISDNLLKLSKTLNDMSKNARNKSSGLKLEVLSDTLLDCSKEISKLK